MKHKRLEVELTHINAKQLAQLNIFKSYKVINVLCVSDLATQETDL